MNLDKKLELAHEWSMWFLDKNKDLAFAPNTVAYNAWDYADAMEAEYNKREKEQKDKIYDPMRAVRNAKEFQPDWSVAPESANYWAMDEDTCCNWYGREPEMIVVRNRWDFGNVLKSSPSFNYQGDWKDSLRKRPKGFFDCFDGCKHDCGTDLTQGLGGFYIKSCKRCGYFVETSEDGKDSLRIRPQEKPKQHDCNCAHWKGSSFFMGDTFTCKDCGGSVTI